MIYSHRTTFLSVWEKYLIFGNLLFPKPIKLFETIDFNSLASEKSMIDSKRLHKFWNNFQERKVGFMSMLINMRKENNKIWSIRQTSNLMCGFNQKGGVKIHNTTRKKKFFIAMVMGKKRREDWCNMRFFILMMKRTFQKKFSITVPKSFLYQLKVHLFRQITLVRLLHGFDDVKWILLIVTFLYRVIKWSFVRRKSFQIHSCMSEITKNIKC